MGIVVSFRLLGDVEVQIESTLVDVGHARQRMVLVVLLLEVNRSVSLDALADRVWGEHQPRRPKDALYGYLSRLRGALSGAGDVAIRRQGRGYVLAADPMSVDVHRFRRLVERARSAKHDDRRALAWYDEAIGLWRGQPFAGLDQPWLSEVRESLDQQRQAAEAERNDIRLNDGLHAQVVDELTAGSAQSLNERLAAQLILALYRCGRPADALRHYEQVRSLLAEELGADPSPQLRRLHEQILVADPALAAAEPKTSPATSTTPRQLPAAPALFRGRTRELAVLGVQLEGVGGASSIAVVTGGGGIGKTWLTLRWAHDHANRFPDGHLYVNLRGFDPAEQPVAPTTAVRGFLSALGIAPAAIPADLDSQTALYRTLTTRRRMLIVLDDARDTAQVTPLLPGGGSSTVLVTSRNQLPGLVSTHAAQPVALGLLTEADARDLLTGRLGRARVDAEPAAVVQILRCCAGLPLALGIVAAHAATRPGLPLVTLAAELSDDTTRLDTLDSDELPASLRAVFSASYNALDADTARAFRLLGLTPGPDITPPAATALTAFPTVQTRALLRRLTNAHLVEEHRPGRFRMHDLIRLYSAELANQADPTADRRAAVTRLLDYYAHAANVAMDHFSPNESYRRPTVTNPVDPAPEFTNFEHARKWLDSERPNLLAAAAHAAAHDWPDHATRLSSTMYRYLDAGAYYHEALALHTNALTATPPNQPSHGYVLFCLGSALIRLGHNEEALKYHEQALRHARTHHDHVLEICATTALGCVRERQRHNDQALKHYAHALTVARAAGRRHCEAIALTNLGDFYRMLGRHDAAAKHLQQGLQIARELGDHGLATTALANLGTVHGFLGRHSDAVDHLHDTLTIARAAGNRTLQLGILIDLGEATLTAHAPSHALHHYQQALTLARDIGSPHEQARAHHGLAQAHHNLNHPTKTRHHLHEALGIYTRLNAPEATDLRQLLGPN